MLRHEARTFNSANLAASIVVFNEQTGARFDLDLIDVSAVFSDEEAAQLLRNFELVDEKALGQRG